ncbi:ASCH domain protein [Aquimixticola soesokkakensis]|uniref:ASCH domain protein n=1 Tax=Aquimixticola soesokkakensis TaxID=1519096 RepID=A0A1Y5SVK6_9RHOB|nr:ASCH domain-containing protein [Aquimixticola soesokkakensis]SLN48813.1 ASCH domain protein [Aquimixticola soesokkakensis]
MTNDPDMEDLQTTYPGAGTFVFGDSAKMSARLTDLARRKTKRANFGDWQDFDGDEDALPKVGRCDIVANWDGTPALVVRTTEVTMVKFNEVTAAMAISEGSKSLADWTATYTSYFKRNGHFEPDMMLVFERFELVEDLADR